MSDLDNLLDAALGAVLSAGWDDEPAPAIEQDDQRQVAAPKFPPLPMKEPVKRARKQQDVAAPTSTELTSKSVDSQIPQNLNINTPAPAEPLGLFDPRPPQDETDEEDDGASFSIGMLTDLATGRMTPQQAAASVGLPVSSLQEALATELRNSTPDDIAKALAIQASEQQLKSGAIYGAVLFDLVRDMSQGRLQPKEKIKFAELLSAVGRIMPKEAKEAGTGGGFTLNIQMGLSDPKTIVLDNN